MEENSGHAQDMMYLAFILIATSSSKNFPCEEQESYMKMNMKDTNKLVYKRCTFDHFAPLTNFEISNKFWDLKILTVLRPHCPALTLLGQSETTIVKDSEVILQSQKG